MFLTLSQETVSGFFSCLCIYSLRHCRHFLLRNSDGVEEVKVTE